MFRIRAISTHGQSSTVKVSTPFSELELCAAFGERRLSQWEPEAGPGNQPRPCVCFSTVGVNGEALCRLRSAAVVALFVCLHGDLRRPRKPLPLRERGGAVSVERLTSRSSRIGFWP